MPFSMIAVILLILAGAGAALLYGVEESRSDRELDLSHLQELQNCAILESTELDQLASDVASEVTRSNGMRNESDLQSRFQTLWLNAIGSTYPERHGDLTVRLVRSSLEIRFLHLSMNDADVVKKSELKDQLGTPSIILPVYVEVAGNYSLKIESQRGSITQVFEMQRSIYDPTPFLANRLQTFKSMFEGGKNEIENLVRYQLAALSQDRILAGAGSGSLTDISGSISVITDQDVRNAMNLAILVEQMKVFRVYDEKFLEETLGQFPCPEEEKLIVDEILHSDVQIDIADIFLLLNDGGHYSLRQILAQSIFSSADAIVLRWLDYLHLIDLAKFVEQVESGFQIAVSDVLEWLTSVDLIEDSMVGWMSERFLDAGIHDYNYRWLHYGSADSYIPIASNSFDFQNHFGDDIEVVIQGNYDIDFPSFDVLSSPVWKEFLIEYKSNTCQLAENLGLFVRSVAMNVASNTNLPEIELKLDPTDSENYLDELVSVVQTVMDPNRDWFEEALSKADQGFVIKDPLGQALAEFASNNWRELFQLNSSVDQTESDLARSIIEEAIAASSFVSDSGMVNEIAEVKNAIQNDASWGVDASIRSIFEEDIKPRLELFDKVFDNIPWEGQSTPLQEAIVNLAGDAIDGIPGIKRIVINQMERQISDLRDQARLRADKVLIQLTGSDGFSFVTENGMVSCESLEVHLEAPWISDPNAIGIAISRPEDFDEQAEDYPNHHLTDPMNCSMSPFESGFAYDLVGIMQVELRIVQNPNSLLARADVNMTISLPFGFRSNYSCSSGWPLQGVEYRPTMTLSKQIAQFLDELWNALLDTLQLIGDACTQVFIFLKDCLSKLLSYSMEAVQALSDILIDLAQGLRDMVQGVVGSIIKDLATTVTATLGQITCCFSIGGLKMTLETCIPDIQFGRSRDLLKWTICIPLVYSNLSFGVRIVEMVRSGLDIIGFCSMAGQDWQAEALVDPLMLVQDHMIEAEGIFPTFSLELMAPEVVQYEKRSFRLSDIPMVGAFLSRIPTPIPGLLASVDAGFEIKYDNPQRDHVVLNEVEFNPPGSDLGNEWVELYNPTNEAVDISGWCLETVHGRQMSEIIGDHEIAPKSYYVHYFTGQFLDNGGGSQLPAGESVVLSDSTGRKIDTTPFLTDYYNDYRTWQRSMDASERWVFKSASEGRANAFKPFPAEDIEVWYNTLYDAAIRAFAKMGQDAFDLNNLAALIKNIIIETVQIVAEILGRLIVEMSLFIELALYDYSQSFSGGIRLSLVITGDGVRDALLWVSSAVQQAISGITNPTQATMGRRPLDTILDDVYIRFSAYGSAGLPRILADALPGAEFRLAGCIQVNLASFITPETGQQNWSVSFGVLFEEVPGRLLNAYYPVDADKSADCWLFKALIHAGSKNGGTMTI
jgi:hypothetical protein